GACLTLVFLMVVVGGLTRLTESGLSIVEWKPISGTLPPLNEADWQAELESYRASPEYQKKNKGMSIEEFKGIFWLEYLHRLLGRLIGLVFIIPLVYFALTKRITRRFAVRLLCIFALGGLQGLIGWLMVKSGLVDDPRVSPYRLALHLSVAFLLFSLLLWSWLDVALDKPKTEVHRAAGKLLLLMKGFLVVLCLQIAWGAFVAGNDAGLTYNTFPLMDGRWIPHGMGLISPWWHNLFENVTTVQFLHRVLAYVVFFYGCYLTFLRYGAFKSLGLHRALNAMFIVMLLQIVIGIKTLLYVVPIGLASLHQANALILLGVTVFILHRLYDIKRAS
ncbi:MAG: heme A synthase, partial [Chitinophagia bacterium]|nr:heme A synthase [Chitinophagia bacterium]